MKSKLPGKKIENLDIRRKAVLCFEILKNSVLSATGSCRKSNRKLWLNGKCPGLPSDVP